MKHTHNARKYGSEDEQTQVQLGLTDEAGKTVTALYKDQEVKR